MKKHLNSLEWEAIPITKPTRISHESGSSVDLKALSKDGLQEVILSVGMGTFLRCPNYFVEMKAVKGNAVVLIEETCTINTDDDTKILEPHNDREPV